MPVGRRLNTTINRSRNEKNDEHYTQLADIENEVRHYRDQFRGKDLSGTLQGAGGVGGLHGGLASGFGF